VNDEIERETTDYRLKERKEEATVQPTTDTTQCGTIMCSNLCVKKFRIIILQ
jgi:hypothetical protein